MIVQSQAPDGSHLVLTMEEHTATAAVLGRHFGGTKLFDRPQPRDLFVKLVAEHDRGWVSIDDRVERDPVTDLPWNVIDAPLSHSLTAGVKTIDYNERCHPFRGLLSSMHIAGLYTGRYGLSEPKHVGDLSVEETINLDEFLASEQARRDRLHAQLSTNSDTAGWVEHDGLMKCYKALQFFDVLALWLQITHPRRRSPMIWDHVPGRDSDHAVLIEQVDDSRVQLTPFPFDTDELPIRITGRRLWPQPAAGDLAAALRDAQPDHQDVLLTA